jgi:uroporphyrinogen-III decarboxylase
MQRISDAISLKIPDRVPIAPDPGFFPFIYAGVSLKEAMYDYEKAHDAWIKTIKTFKWDATMPPYTYSANVFEILGYKQLLWPGHGLKDDAVAFQFVEPSQMIRGKVWYEAMKPEEYDWFLDDPSDYLLRIYFPRVFERLKPFYNFIPIHGIICWYQGLFEALSTPNVAEAFLILAEATREASKWFNSFVNFIKRLKSLGFPFFSLSCTHAPFDYLANFLRGTKGAFIDMFKCPDKLIKTCEKITPWMVQTGVTGAKLTGNPIVSIFLHKGAFMNPVQFTIFYWPSLKKVISGLIDNNLIPYVCTEGNYTPFFEIIKDVPKRKVIYHIEKDIFKAKEALGERICLTGGPPNSLLIAGTSKDVIKYCKKLIATVGEGGGYIMDAEAPLINANPVNVKAMTDTVMKFGRYKK